MSEFSVVLTAKILGKTAQFVRLGLQQGTLPIGSAVKMPGGRWSYYVSPKLLMEYVGEEAINECLGDKKVRHA